MVIHSVSCLQILQTGSSVSLIDLIDPLRLKDGILSCGMKMRSYEDREGVQKGY